MRINLFISSATGMSRRAADKAIESGKVKLNDGPAHPGDQVNTSDLVIFEGKKLKLSTKTTNIILNKPVGYVCSRNGQGNKTIYDLLPADLHNLKPVGRLDKDSSGLLLLTNDGQLAHHLTHPKFAKVKVYEVTLNKPLTESDKENIERGIRIDNYISHLRLSKNENSEPKIDNCSWIVAMSMGRNRQIRRTFDSLGYRVTTLHRIKFGTYHLNGLTEGKYLHSD